MGSVFQEKEVLNVMDEVGSLWQISIEGSRVRVINSAPQEVHIHVLANRVSCGFGGHCRCNSVSGLAGLYSVAQTAELPQLLHVHTQLYMYSILHVCE